MTNHDKLGKIMKNHEKSRKIKGIKKIRKNHGKLGKIMKNHEISRRIMKSQEK